MLRAISQLFQKKPKPEVSVSEPWKKHIQPVLDSWEWDNYSWVWDPFLEKYPNFDIEQQIEVEDALRSCAFDLSDEKLAVKALSIAENLYKAHLATPRLTELFRSELRKHFETLPLDREISVNYVFAYSAFEMTEAIPFIKLTVVRLNKAREDNPVDERSELYRKLFRACCLSLLLLKDDSATSYFAKFMELEFNVKKLAPNTPDRSPFDLINFWQYIGSHGLKTITNSMQAWPKEELEIGLPRLIMATEKIHYRDNLEKQEVEILVENLRNSINGT